MELNYWSITKLGMGMDKLFHLTLRWFYDNFLMLIRKLIIVDTGPRETADVANPYFQFVLFSIMKVNPTTQPWKQICRYYCTIVTFAQYSIHSNMYFSKITRLNQQIQLRNVSCKDVSKTAAHICHSQIWYGKHPLILLRALYRTCIDKIYHLRNNLIQSPCRPLLCG